MRHIAIALLLFAAAAGVFTWLSFPLTKELDIPERPVHATEVSLVRIVDGDTIVVRTDDGKEETVRYIGIDAPEYDQSTGRGQAFGRQAHDANATLLKDGPVWVGLDREHRDQYGRLLAYVYSDTDFVNAVLVRDGLAQVLAVPPNERHLDLLLQLQAEALQAGRGLWGEAKANIIDWQDAPSHIDDVATVEGVVVRAHKDEASGITFLNFSADVGRDFVAIISAPYEKQFPKPPQSFYPGKRVRVVGLVQSYEGQPQIAVQIPGQIEVLD